MRTDVSMAEALADKDAIRRSAQADGLWTLYYEGDELPSLGATHEARQLPILDFRARFTDAELAGIVASADASVKVLLLKLTTRVEVDLDDPQVIGGLGLLVSKGLLTAQRRDEILA